MNLTIFTISLRCGEFGISCLVSMSQGIIGRKMPLFNFQFLVKANQSVNFASSPLSQLVL